MEHALRAREYDQRRVDRDPANAEVRLDLSFDLTSIAAYYSNILGAHSEAAPYIHEALAIRRRLLEVDPTNAWIARSLWYPLMNVAYLSWRMEDFAALESGLRAFREYQARALMPAPPLEAAWVEFLSGELAHRQARLDDACAAWLQARDLALAQSSGVNWSSMRDAQSRLALCPDTARR